MTPAEMRQRPITTLPSSGAVVVFWRLAARGPSRMSRALYTIAAVLLGVWLLGIVVTLLQGAASG